MKMFMEFSAMIFARFVPAILLQGRGIQGRANCNSTKRALLQDARKPSDLSEAHSDKLVWHNCCGNFIGELYVNNESRDKKQ
jgi:hypothetical protein